MRIENGGIFREIDEKDFGKFQQKGWTKVIKTEKAKEKKEEEIVIPVKHKDIIDDAMDEVLGEFNLDTPAKPKPKVKKK